MRIRHKTLWGKIDSQGNLLARWDEAEAFCSLQKGKNAIIRIDIVPKEPSEKTKNYWFGYLIPEMQNVFLENGERYTKEETDNTIRSLCPMFIEEKRENGVWKRRVKEFEELSQEEANEAIEWLFEYASENYYTILENPND